MSIDTPERAISKAKIHLMSTKGSAFFAHCCLSMHHVIDDSIPTAATDGEKCYYNTDFFMKQSPAKRVGLMLHEVMHPAMMHFERIGSRCPDIWNMAGDHANNLLILGAGFELPDNGLWDKKYTGWTVEKIYDDLIKSGKKMPDDLKDMMPGPAPGDTAGQKAMKEKWDDILCQAVMQSRMAKEKPGSIPGSVEIYVETLLNPEIPWHRVLSSFFTKMRKTDYTFRKPNRRYRPRYILPTQLSEAICDIAVGIDTSCSVTDKQFHHFISETAGMLRNLRPDKLTLIQFDTQLRGEPDELKDLNDIQKVKFTGRGGTQIAPLMAWAKENKPAVLVVFTDGHYEVPDNPGCPVIWIINNNKGFSCHFGKHIEYNFKEAA